MKTAVLIVGHGSRLPAGNEEVRQFAKRIEAQLPEQLLVETCFLEFESPNIAQGMKACVERGAQKIITIPIMLLQAGHSKIHIPMAIDEAKELYPHVSITYGRPLGIHPSLIDILEYRLAESGFVKDEQDEDTTVLLVARGGSDLDSNSDVYKIARLLSEQIGVRNVEPAFMGVTYPTVDEGIMRCEKLGAKKVYMLPYFLFTGILMERMTDWKARYDTEYDMDITLCEYFGYHSLLEKVVIERIEEALAGDVKMNCDTCTYRINASEFVDHHHHHDHDHDHGHHHHHHDHDHNHSHDHAHDHKEVHQ